MSRQFSNVPRDHTFQHLQLSNPLQSGQVTSSSNYHQIVEENRILKKEKEEMEVSMKYRKDAMDAKYKRLTEMEAHYFSEGQPGFMRLKISELQAVEKRISEKTEELDSRIGDMGVLQEEQRLRGESLCEQEKKLREMEEGVLKLSDISLSVRSIEANDEKLLSEIASINRNSKELTRITLSSNESIDIVRSQVERGFQKVLEEEKRLTNVLESKDRLERTLPTLMGSVDVSRSLITQTHSRAEAIDSKIQHLIGKVDSEFRDLETSSEDIKIALGAESAELEKMKERLEMRLSRIESVLEKANDGNERIARSVDSLSVDGGEKILSLYSSVQALETELRSLKECSDENKSLLAELMNLILNERYERQNIKSIVSRSRCLDR